MRFAALLTLTLVLAAVAAASLTVRLKYFDVEHEGGGFAVKWEAETEEADVRNYELFRKTSYAAEFVLVESRQAHGANQEYVVRDDDVYKNAMDQIDYRLEVVFSNGLRQRLAEKKVNYTPTAIRRSWGSIKAMFQD